MPLDIESLTPRAREHYLALGPRYPAVNVLAQANASLLALRQYAAALAAHGFGAPDAQRLEQARDALLTYLTTRSQAQADRKSSRSTLASARRSAREERRSARAVLEMAAAELLETQDEAAWFDVDTVLEQTRRLPGTRALPVQMQVLLQALSHSSVARLVADRGGDEIAQRLSDAHDALLATEHANAAHPEVRAATEYRNLVSGIVISLVRGANAAAAVAARRLGQPAIATAFKLVHLEPPRKKRAAAAPPPADDEPATPAGEPAPSDAAAPANEDDASD